MDITGKIILMVNEIKDISEKDRNCILELLEHSEWGVAFEILCSTLEQEGIEVTSLQYKNLKDMGEYMEFDDGLWNKLKHPPSA